MIKKLLSSQLRINMASSVATHCVNIAVLAVTYPIYLHYLGYEKYGIWLALGAVLAFARLSDLGMAQAVTKLVAEDLGKGSTQTVQQYVATAIVVLSVAGGVTLAVILVFRLPIISVFKFTEENARVALWLLPYIAVLSIYALIVQVVTATLAGLGRMDLSNYAETVRRIVLVLVVVPLLYFGQGLKSLLIATAMSHLAKHLLSLLLIRRIVHFRLMRLGNISRHCFKRLWGIGAGLFGGSVVRMVGMPFNRFMLARFAGVESLPVFEIAWQGSVQIQQIFGVGLQALMPEVSRTASEMSVKSIKRIRSIMRRVQKFILFCGVPLYALLFLLATSLLRVWLGKSFVDTIPPAFRIMLVGTFISLLAVPAYHFLVGSGRIGNVFTAACITWTGSMTFVLFYSLYFQRLSPFVVCACFCGSRLVSSAFLIWRLHSGLRHDAEKVSSFEAPYAEVKTGPKAEVYESV